MARFSYEKLVTKSIPSRIFLYNRAIDLNGTPCIINRVSANNQKTRRDIYGDPNHNLIYDSDDDFRLVFALNEVMEIIDYDGVHNVDNLGVPRGAQITVRGLVRSDLLITVGDKVTIPYSNIPELGEVFNYKLEVAKVLVYSKNIAYQRQVQFFSLTKDLSG